jgi:type I restriction enzyme, S subunit
MKNGWQVRTLDQISINLDSQRVPITKAVRKNGEYPYYGASGVVDYVADYIFDGDRLLVSEDGANLLARSTPIAFSASGKYWVNNHAHILKFDDGSTQQFVEHYLESITLDQYVTGMAQPKLTQKALNSIPIPFPPLPEQRRIVGILDEAFAGIAIAKANAEKNLQNARALFESHLQGVFTRRGKGWNMEKLDVLTDLARGHNPPKSTFSREAKPGYVRFYQIRDGGTDDYTVYVPDTPQLHKMKKDDIMMVAYRHVGRAFRGVEGAFNVALCKISNARRDLLDDDYLFEIIPSSFVKGELLKRSERSLIPSMSIEHLRELKIPLPPLCEQHRIVEITNRLKKETKRLETLYQRKLAALEELKKSLLHRAFSGEL